MKYRTDIDGLRAVAVLAVVAFHLAESVPGGFVGVDVFFVISGYLISGIILQDMQAQRFSITDFYVRRVRRILPALIFMLAATSLGGAGVLLPVAFDSYAESLIATTFSVSNLYFWRTSDYFDALGQAKPLLHTWSLAVEEQFYLLFPPLLILARRFAPRRSLWIIAAIAAVSFALSAVGAYRTPVTTFFLPHTRAWELLLGVLLAMGAAPHLSGARLRNLVASAGLALVLGSILFLNEGAPFPGVAALPPCLGAALIIWAGSHGETWVSRLLSFKPIVFVGLISYSLYLWHWPIIVLLEQHLGQQDLSRSQKLAVLMASFAMAALSWRFVEQPFRRSRAPRRQVFAAAGLASFAVAAIGGIIVAMHGAPARFPPQVVRLAGYMDYADKGFFRHGQCNIRTQDHYRDFEPALCLKRSATAANVLILGDSYAGHLWYGLSHAMPETNLMQASAIGCKPTLTHGPDARRPDCLALVNHIFHDVLPREPVDLLILSANWQPDDLPRLEATLAWAKAQGWRVAVIGPGVAYDASLPWLLAVAELRHDPGLPARHRWAGPAEVDAQLAAITARMGVPYGSAYAALCPNGECATQAEDGAPLQFDNSHYTRETSALVGRRLVATGVFSAPLNAR